MCWVIQPRSISSLTAAEAVPYLGLNGARQTCRMQNGAEALFSVALTWSCARSSYSTPLRLYASMAFMRWGLFIPWVTLCSCRALMIADAIIWSEACSNLDALLKCSARGHTTELLCCCFSFVFQQELTFITLQIIVISFYHFIMSAACCRSCGDWNILDDIGYCRNSVRSRFFRQFLCLFFRGYFRRKDARSCHGPKFSQVLANWWENHVEAFRGTGRNEHFFSNRGKHTQKTGRLRTFRLWENSDRHSTFLNGSVFLLVGCLLTKQSGRTVDFGCPILSAYFKLISFQNLISLVVIRGRASPRNPWLVCCPLRSDLIAVHSLWCRIQGWLP